jgi:hypothetical protein
MVGEAVHDLERKRYTERHSGLEIGLAEVAIVPSAWVRPVAVRRPVSRSTTVCRPAGIGSDNGRLSEVIDVRYGSHLGPNSDIAQLPGWADAVEKGKNELTEIFPCALVETGIS